MGRKICSKKRATKKTAYSLPYRGKINMPKKPTYFQHLGAALRNLYVEEGRMFFPKRLLKKEVQELAAKAGDDLGPRYKSYLKAAISTLRRKKYISVIPDGAGNNLITLTEKAQKLIDRVETDLVEHSYDSEFERHRALCKLVGHSLGPGRPASRAELDKEITDLRQQLDALQNKVHYHEQRCLGIHDSMMSICSDRTISYCSDSMMSISGDMCNRISSFCSNAMSVSSDVTDRHYSYISNYTMLEAAADCLEEFDSEGPATPILRPASINNLAAYPSPQSLPRRNTSQDILLATPTPKSRTPTDQYNYDNMDIIDHSESSRHPSVALTQSDVVMDDPEPVVPGGLRPLFIRVFNQAAIVGGNFLADTLDLCLHKSRLDLQKEIEACKQQEETILAKEMQIADQTIKIEGLEQEIEKMMNKNSNNAYSEGLLPEKRSLELRVKECETFLNTLKGVMGVAPVFKSSTLLLNRPEFC